MVFVILRPISSSIFATFAWCCIGKDSSLCTYKSDPSYAGVGAKMCVKVENRKETAVALDEKMSKGYMHCLQRMPCE